MNVRRAHLGRIFENGLQQLDDRRLFEARRHGQRAKVDGVVTELSLQFLRKARDLTGAAVNAVNHAQQLRFSNNGDFNLAFYDTCDFVIRSEVGRIGHADLQRLRIIFEHDGAEPARLRLRQLLHHLRLDVVILEIDVRHLQLLCQGLRNLLFSDIPLLDEHPAELATAAFLFIKREFELFGCQQILLNEDFAEANFFGAGHARIIPTEVLLDQPDCGQAQPTGMLAAT